MSLWRQLTRGLRVLVHRARADQDVSDEVNDYLERATAANVARGLAPDAARRAARLELGNVTVAREQVRAYGWENVVAVLGADLRYAARRLRRNPGFTAVCVSTLALGIGASAAIFSAVYPVLLAPLPYPHGDRIVTLADRGADGAPMDVTYGTYREMSARSRSFVALAVADRWQPALIGAAEPERLSGDRVSAAYFRALGIAPRAGRDFADADELPNMQRVAIISDGLAARRFGGARAILGRPITLGGDPYTVIGVMPPGFENVLSSTVEVWTPLRYRANAPFEGPEWGHHLRMVGRLAPGVSLQRARSEVVAIGTTRSPDFLRPPWASMEQGLTVASLRADVTRTVRPALLAIAGAVFLVLAIACVNVTNLLLFAGTRRRGELAMRAALGAGRGRIVRQLVTESLLLASAAGALGLGVTAVGVRTLAALAPAGLPRGDAIRLEVPVFVFALVLTTLVGLVVGSWPAIHAARDDLRAGVGSSARTTRGGDHTLRRVLVVAEVALALVLLVGAGLMLRTLQRLFATAPGFDASHVLTMQVQAAGHRYDADEARRLFFEQALDAVRRLPGVTEAAFSSQLPLSGDLDAYGVVFESAARKDPNDYGAALRYAVTPGWFRAMGIPLRSGRLLDVRDLPGAPEAVVINESFARRLFPGRDPIGARVRMGPEIGQAERPWDVVVGVVGDVKQTSLTIGGEDALYVAMGQWQWVDGVQSLVVRTTGDPAALALPVKRAIWSVDHGQPILRIAPMAQLVATSEAQRRFVLIVFEAFALAAVLLGAVGIYGVLAANVAERRREIGVRAALGAARGDIVALVVRQGLALAGAGAAVGLLGAATASRALDSLLFGVSRLDPATYVAALALLGAVSAAACCVPAWRAARVDPAIALDAE